MSCRQDVPGVLNVVGGSHVCPRCGTLLADDAGLDLAALAHDEATAEFGLVDSGEASLPNVGRPTPIGTIVSEGMPEQPDFEPITPPKAEPTRATSLRWEAANWELNEKLRHVERVTSAGTYRRFDAPAAVERHGPHFDTAGRMPSSPRGEAPPPSFAPPAHSPYESPSFAPSPFPSPLGPSAPAGPGPHAPASPYETSPHEWNERTERRRDRDRSERDRHEEDYDDYEDDFDDRYEPAPVVARSSGTTSAEFAASLMSWLFLGLAVGAFSCGGFLAGWGAIAARPNLERLGMPIILGGLLAMVIGVLPQLFLRHAEEERRRRTAEQRESHRETRGHAGPRGPHFHRRRSREYDRSRDDSADY